MVWEGVLQAKEILRSVQGYVLDLDGTLYLGNRLIEGAMAFTQKLQQKEIPHLYVTNNSSHDAEFYVKKLYGMGLQVNQKDIYTSGQASADEIIMQNPSARVYVLGNSFLKRELTHAGVHLVEENPDLVLIGFDTDLTYAKLQKTCDFIRNGVPYWATHPDFNCPTETGFMPDCGAILAFIKASTDKEADLIIGKPFAPMAQGIAKRLNLPLQHLVMIGDRLYTDMQMQKHGMKTVLVLSGETKAEDVACSDIQPHLVADSIADLIELV